MSSQNYLRKPEWLRVKLPVTEDFIRVERDLDRLHVGTVCRSAKCPNIFECFSNKKATFLILGRVCTRNCGFCSVAKGTPEKVDFQEPERVSEAVSKLGLKHVVITSVTRDDLDDGGSRHFASVLVRLKKDHPQSTVEVLVPDFQGSRNAVDRVLEAGPDVFGHNLETVKRLYPRIRPKADYDASLSILNYAGKKAPQMRVKTGIMAGLGEEEKDILGALRDISDSGCQIVTIGQYLRPSKDNLTVKDYIRPEKFQEYQEAGKEMGLVMYCGPLVRSSYHAEDLFLKNE
jgi:lipoic acid synthetase